eukprot:5358469-Pyramimonas_sp.AAC.1
MERNCPAQQNLGRQDAPGLAEEALLPPPPRANLGSSVPAGALALSRALRRALAKSRVLLEVPLAP